jgi:peptidoglycan/LPS O-acetylase OafA/YrhL
MTSFFGVAMGYGPLWSLAVEEHFYILWPTVIHKLKSGSLILLLIAICVLVPVARAIAFRYDHGVGIDWYTWFVADGLAIGSLLAIVLRRPIQRTTVATLCTVFLTAIPILAGVAARYGVLSRQRILGAACRASTAVLIARNGTLETLGQPACSSVLWVHQLRALSFSPHDFSNLR